MTMKYNWRLLLLTTLTLAGMNAYALPALQLGPDDASDPSWTWDAGTQTWVFDGTSLTLNAYANATSADGGKGAYAWDESAVPPQTKYAYLVMSSIPQQGELTWTDNFDATISNATFKMSGFGTPPVSDPNDLAPHGIFDNYYEIYEFVFDGALTDIYDVQPPCCGGNGKGYVESFTIDFGSSLGADEGVHFDLFTVDGDGYLELNSAGDIADNSQVMKFAPFSHDAEAMRVPEPSGIMITLLGLALIGLSRIRRAAI